MSAQTEVRSTGKSDEQLLVEALDRQIIHRRVSEEELARALELLGQSGREVIAGLVERHGHPKALRQAFARGAARTSGAMRAALMDLGASDYFALRREVAPKVARKRSREWFFSCRREARRDGVSETALEEAIELVGRDVIL
jgi:D-arabinose 1-dehydrogenase-like Zn-dependent alcohol dehydrogenase